MSAVTKNPMQSARQLIGAAEAGTFPSDGVPTVEYLDSEDRETTPPYLVEQAPNKNQRRQRVAHDTSSVVIPLQAIPEDRRLEGRQGYGKRSIA